MSRKPLSRIHEWALRYATNGWPVLPLVPRAKRPLTRNGLLDASIDNNVINDWWNKWPNANVGLRTGVVFDVLDIDGDVGRASLEAKAGAGTVHPGPASRTGKGEHWLYMPTGTACKAGLLSKLDWRGINGYIVAPPSIHPDGHEYQWHTPFTTTLTPPPHWLVPFLSPYKPPSRDRNPIRVIQTHQYDSKNPIRISILDQKQLTIRLTSIFDAAHDLGYETRQSGSRQVMNCIFHEGDHEASLMLYPDNRFYCFGCNAWGNVLDLKRGVPGGRRV
jgi:hypothetical protein